MTATLLVDDVGRREETARLGLWMFLATVTMLFAAFSSAYVVRRAGSDWQRIELPAALWVSTVLLAASSGALEVGHWWGVRDRWGRASAAMATALVLGCGFLLCQAVAWRGLTLAGIYLPTNPHSSFFFMMTGAHAVHVVAALGVLAWGGIGTWTQAGRYSPRRWRATMGTCRTFWHYLLAVWIYLFALTSFL